MAIRELVLTCDHCGYEDEEQENLAEAYEDGWYEVKGPERHLGGRGERAYCSQECLVMDMA